MESNYERLKNIIFCGERICVNWLMVDSGRLMQISEKKYADRDLLVLMFLGDLLCWRALRKSIIINSVNLC